MIEAVFYIETQGNNKDAVQKTQDELLSKMKEDKGLEVIKASSGNVLEEHGTYSVTSESEAEFKDFKTYVRSCVMYGPSAITVEAPSKITLTSKEFLTSIAEVQALIMRAMDRYDVKFNAPEIIKDVKVGLDEEEIEGLLDQGALRAKIVVERPEEEEAAKKTFLSAIESEVFVDKVKTSTLEDRSLVAVNGFMYEARTLFDIAMTHQPVLIELIEPEVVELSLYHIQDIGVELAATFFELAHLAVKPLSPS